MTKNFIQAQSKDPGEIKTGLNSTLITKIFRNKGTTALVDEKKLSQTHTAISQQLYHG